MQLFRQLFMSKIDERYIKIEDGLAVYLPNAATSTWWCRIRKDGEELKFSLKTREIITAKGRAYAYKYGLTNSGFDVEKVTKTTFKKFNSEIEEYLKKSYSTQTLRGVLRQYHNYFLPNFKDRDVKSVKVRDVEKVINDNNLQKTLLSDFKMCSDKIFQYLLENNFIEKTVKLSKNKKFTDSYDAFLSSEISFLYEEINRLLNGNNKHYKEQHKYKSQIMLYYSMLIEIGARPNSELTKIRFCDIEKVNDDQYNLRILNGKNSKSNGKRIIPLYKNFIIGLMYLISDSKKIPFLNGYSYNLIEIKEAVDKEIENSEDLVFKDITYTMIYNVFKTALKNGIDCGKIRKNKNFAPYSFRHSYINRALKAGVDVYLIAKTVGNTVAVIQSNYDNLEVIERSQELKLINSPF